MNILLTSTGRRTYLVEYFKDALRGKGKVFAANSEYTYALSQADECVITPLIYSEEYIPYILDYCKANDINVVISLFDIDLPILSKNKKLFEVHNIKLIISDTDVIDICNDKWLTFNFLLENNIATPLTFIDKVQAVVALDSGALNYPVIMKPRWGMGSIGIYKADNLEELEVFYRKISNEIKNSYLK
jgi:carbamoyl-phosphate synthase large subunit